MKTQGECRVKTEAEIGIMLPQTKEYQEWMATHQKLEEARQESLL